MRQFALVGLPNTGKSSLFNRLTGLSQRVGNWPGLTVELAHARLLLGNQMVGLTDLPGIHDLSGYTDDEAVVRDVLGARDFDALVLVLNATSPTGYLSIPGRGLPPWRPCRPVPYISHTPAPTRFV